MDTLEQTLRKNATDAEQRLWYRLRDRRLGGYKFRRQHRIDQYIVDFVCLKKRLVVELDGSQHLLKAAQDQQRTQVLNGKGYRVIRFWNHQVFSELDVVLEQILRCLEEGPPHPNPLPQGEREC